MSGRTDGRTLQRATGRATAHGVRPTVGNTWVRRTSRGGLVAGLHWCDFTTRASVTQVLDSVRFVLGEFHDRGYGSALYRSAWLGPHASTVEAGFRRRGADHVRVSLTGEACEALGLLGAWALVDALGGKVTRVDVALDGAPFKPRTLYRAWQRGHVRTKVPRDHPDSASLLENAEGATFYLGTPASDRRLRVYDRRGPTRVEMQLRRGMAEAWWSKVGEASDAGIGALALGLVAGFVEFAAPDGSDTNRSRWSRLGWWDAFVGGTVALVGLVSRTPTALHGLVGHVWRNAAAVATYLDAVKALGHDAQRALGELLHHGTARRSARHRALLAGVRSAAPALVGV